MTLAADNAADRQSSAAGEEWTSQRRLVALLGIAAAILAILPLLVARHLPLLDAAGHESRLTALFNILVTRRGSDFYEFGSFFLPNVAFDLIGLPLVAIVGPEIAGRIFFGLTLILTLSGVSILNRVAIGRWSVAPLVSALLLYNLISVLGFFSFAFGLALVPWALAGRLLLERARHLPRHLLGALFGLVLLFCHVFDFGIYAVMAAGFAATALASRRIGFGRAILWGAEFLPAAALFLAMSTSGAGRPRFEGQFIHVKLFGLVKAVTAGSMAGDVAFVAGALGFVTLVALCARPRLVPSFVPGVVGLTVLYLALPDKLASGSYVDKRMPIAIALMLLAGLDLRVRRSTLAATLIGLVGLALVAKQAALAALWRSFDPLIDSLAASLDRLPAGAVIMQAECEPESTDIASIYRERQPSMTHLPAMASFDDSRFVAATWAIAGQQTVQVAAAYKPYYDLQEAFGSSTCSEAGYQGELRQIENLGWAQKAAGNRVPPLYFLLIRPPKPETLADAASLRAGGPHFELYEVRTP